MPAVPVRSDQLYTNTPPTGLKLKRARSAATVVAAAVALAPARRTDYDMDSYMPFIMLTLCACARGEPSVYGSDYAPGYKPVTYAALSLHSPIPVLHILSRGPLRRPVAPDSHTSASEVMPMYAHPYSPHVYAASMNNFVHDSYKETDEPTILYARPNPQGGYSYRRRPSKKRSPPPEPLVIRVHKYKIIKDW